MSTDAVREGAAIVETVAGYLPFSHAVDAMRVVLADGAGFGDLAGDLARVTAYTIAAITLAITTIDHRMAE